MRSNNRQLGGFPCKGLCLPAGWKPALFFLFLPGSMVDNGIAIEDSNGLPRPTQDSNVAVGFVMLPGRRPKFEVIWLRTCFSLLKRSSFLIPVLSVLTSAANLSAQETENQFWPEIKTYVTLSGKTRLYFDYAATRTDNLRTYSDGQLGAYFDFYCWRLFRSRAERSVDAARSKTILIRAGYFLDRTPADSEDPYVAHVPSVEIYPRMELPGKVQVTDRNRFDLRIVDGIYRPRYRNRLKFERTFKSGRLELTPYADAEFFYGWQYDRFFRTRFETGVEWTVTRHFILEGYYARQRDTYPSDGFLNAVGIVAQFYLRNK